VADQKYVLDKLLDLLNDYNNEPNFRELFFSLADVKKAFEKLATQGEDENAKVQINERDLKVVTEKISDLRTKLVSQ
jgi:vacuolar-type H+-ATPase subunit E/Vma4